MRPANRSCGTLWPPFIARSNLSIHPSIGLSISLSTVCFRGHISATHLVSLSRRRRRRCIRNRETICYLSSHLAIHLSSYLPSPVRSMTDRMLLHFIHPFQSAEPDAHLFIHRHPPVEVGEQMKSSCVTCMLSTGFI